MRVEGLGSLPALGERRVSQQLDAAGVGLMSVQQFRGGLAFKAHRLCTVGLRVIKKKKNITSPGRAASKPEA